MVSLWPLNRHVNHPVLVSIAKLGFHAILPIVIYKVAQRSSLLKCLPGAGRYLVELFPENVQKLFIQEDSSTKRSYIWMASVLQILILGRCYCTISFDTLFDPHWIKLNDFIGDDILYSALAIYIRVKGFVSRRILPQCLRLRHKQQSGRQSIPSH